MTVKRVPVLYLDIDGTVRHGKEQLGRYVNTVADVVIFPEAITHMQRWKDNGGRIIGVSNQGGIALGHMSFTACAQTMIRTHQLTGGLFDKLAWCRHHPAAADPEMARCWCRKPAPGLLIEAAVDLARAVGGEIYPPHLALMVGDRIEDRDCARNANVDFMDATEWRAQR
jgi:D-glycero-D-manno-heptose 1,7-bisphosphate phosphatase